MGWWVSSIYSILHPKWNFSLFLMLPCSWKNGAAERKHHHIVEKGLSLLAHYCVPFKFWDDAFVTVVFLINRLPTPLLGNITPLENYLIPLPIIPRVFGCVCYPHICPYNQHKLDFRSTKCLFLGYSSTRKGYKCLDQHMGRIYITPHVIFDEVNFPYSNANSSNPSSNSPSCVPPIGQPPIIFSPQSIYNISSIPSQSLQSYFEST